MKTPDLSAMGIIELLGETAIAVRSSYAGRRFAAEHSILSAPTLTVDKDEVAGLIAAYLAPRIRGKTVVDVGGAIGFLGLHMADIARHVFVIEANPIWSLAYVEFFHRHKPANLSFCFGVAQEFVGQIKADIAVVVTHSDVTGMMSIASRLAPTAIDIYGELIAANPNVFDEWARNARGKA